MYIYIYKLDALGRTISDVIWGHWVFWGLSTSGPPLPPWLLSPLPEFAGFSRLFISKPAVAPPTYFARGITAGIRGLWCGSPSWPGSSCVSPDSCFVCCNLFSFSMHCILATYILALLTTDTSHRHTINLVQCHLICPVGDLIPPLICRPAGGII